MMNNSLGPGERTQSLDTYSYTSRQSNTENNALSGHVVSCLGWGTHSLAPLSFRGATYSGVFTLYPLISGRDRAHHGEILTHITALVEAGKLKPLLNSQVISMADINTAHSFVESGAVGKVVVEVAS